MWWLVTEWVLMILPLAGFVSPYQAVVGTYSIPICQWGSWQKEFLKMFSFAVIYSCISCLGGVLSEFDFFD